MVAKSKILASCLIATMLVTACGTYNVVVRALYGLDTDNYKRAEKALINLYRNGTFKTNADDWNQMIARSIPNYPQRVIPNEWNADGYRKGTSPEQDFLVYYPQKHCYYGMEITNCGGAFGCDVFVRSIVIQDSMTGAQVRVPWEEAGPALKDFEDNFLPAIRTSVAATPK